MRSAPHVRAEADAKGRTLAPEQGPFEEHEQALKAAAAAAGEVGRFAAALPPLPVWDSLPVPAVAVDERGAEPGGGFEADIGPAARFGGGAAASEPVPVSIAQAGGPPLGEAAPAPEMLTSAAPSAAGPDTQPAESAQPCCVGEGAADPGAEAMEVDGPASRGSPPDAAAQETLVAQTAAADTADAEALAAADLAADASAKDRRCARSMTEVPSIRYRRCIGLVVAQPGVVVVGAHG